MIDVREIEEEIRKLEQSETSYAVCSKLADLYAVRDHFQKPKKAEYSNYNSNYSYGQSEFLIACSNAPIDSVLNVLDEHMEAIKILYPKEYSALIKKIREP